MFLEQPRVSFYNVMYLLMAYRFDSHCLFQVLPLDVIHLIASSFRRTNDDVYFEHYRCHRISETKYGAHGRPYSVTSGEPFGTIG
jgi:hypothetical protein